MDGIRPFVDISYCLIGVEMTDKSYTFEVECWSSCFVSMIPAITEQWADRHLLTTNYNLSHWQEAVLTCYETYSSFMRHAETLIYLQVDIYIRNVRAEFCSFLISSPMHPSLMWLNAALTTQNTWN